MIEETHACKNALGQNIIWLSIYPWTVVLGVHESRQIDFSYLIGWEGNYFLAQSRGYKRTGKYVCEIIWIP